MSNSAPRIHDEQDSSYGVSIFAGVLLVTLAAFEILQGLSAVLKDDVYVKGVDYAYKFDLTGWGWIHMLIGAIGVAVGVGILMGQGVGLLRRHRVRRAVGPGQFRVPARLPVLVDADHRHEHPGDLGAGQADRPSPLSQAGRGRRSHRGQ